MRNRSRQEDISGIDVYTALAEIYDELMEHVDYIGWADYIVSLFFKYGMMPEKVLELACGTGSLLLELSRQRIYGTGLDRSMPMLKAAKKKFGDNPDNLALIQGDITAVPAGRCFDAILCLYDSMNYLDSVQTLVTAVENIMSRVLPGGIFIFDICTEHNSVKHFNGNIYSENIGGWHYKRQCFYDERNRMQINNFTLTDKKTGTVLKERHKQYIFPVDEVFAELSLLPMKNISMFKDYTTSPPDKSTERVHFVLRKK